MRVIALIVLIGGLVIAGGAVFLASNKYEAVKVALQQQAEEARKAAKEAPPAIETVSVAVAVRALRYGQPLKTDHVKFVDFPKDSAPANAFATPEDLFGGEDDQRIVLRAIEPNEPILKSKVTGFGERATISAQLTPGMRAFTIRIDSVSGVAGFLLPNDRVDVFLTRKGADGLATNLILQNVKVIAVDQFSDQDSNKARVARTATVEVTPDDAQRLALAQQIGRISLSLRQIDEVATEEEPSSIRIDDIIREEQVEAPVEAAPAPAPQQRVCVRKGVELFCQ